MGFRRWKAFTSRKEISNDTGNGKALSDSELLQVIAWAQGEQKAREQRRKQETIAKIKELARSVDVGSRLRG